MHTDSVQVTELVLNEPSQGDIHGPWSIKPPLLLSKQVAERTRSDVEAGEG